MGRPGARFILKWCMLAETLALRPGGLFQG
jgi:hypothetical protein